jgi:hypothetical protein
MASPKVVLLTKAGYRQAGFSRGLLVLLLGLDTVCRQGGDGWPSKLLLTAGSNDHTTGGHALPRCDAVDVRTKPSGDRPYVFRDGAAKRAFLSLWAHAMDDGPVLRVWEDGTKLVTAHYFFWLEAEGESREHIHAQVRKGMTIRP